MNRRKFFSFLPSAAVSTAAGVASALAHPVKADEIEGLVVTSEGSLTIQNCHFVSNGAPVLTIKTKD